MKKDLKQPTFKIVTKGFDWGPGNNKMIVDFKTTLEDTAALNMKIEAEKRYKNYDFATKKSEEGILKEEIKIKNYYLSDGDGTKLEQPSQFVTLELEVHPDNVLTNPFMYDFDTGLNSYEPIEYEVSLLDSITDADNQEIKPFTLTNKDYIETLEPEAKLFEMETFNYTDKEYGDITLTYASFSPDNHEVKKPLIILLHGAGEGGTDPRIALYGNKSVALASDNIQSYFEDGAYVLVPQTPTMWMDIGDRTYTKTGKSKYTNALLALIEEYIENHNVDADRVYVGGGSNGGFMTINVLLNKPSLFAAGFPICQAYASEWISEEELKKLADIPLWFVHAVNDQVVLFEKTAKDLSDRLRQLNAKEVIVSTFEDVVDTSGEYKTENNEPYKYSAHWSWIYVYNDEVKEDGRSLFEWLAAKKR